MGVGNNNVLLKVLTRSKSASEHIDDTNEGLGVPLDCHSSIHLIIPIAGPRKVESTICFLHDDAVCYKFEVLVDVGDGLEDLSKNMNTSSQI